MKLKGRHWTRYLFCLYSPLDDFFAHLDFTSFFQYFDWCFEFLTPCANSARLRGCKLEADNQLNAPNQPNSALVCVLSVSALHCPRLGQNQNKENVICENLKFKWNSKFFLFNSFQLKNSMEKYWCGDMFSKPSGLFTPPVEENDSETKGQLISKEILVSYELENFNFSPKGSLISESL